MELIIVISFVDYTIVSDVFSASWHVSPHEGDRCEHCLARAPLDFKFTFAFQPIVDMVHGEIMSYEALVRGSAGESAAWVLEQIDDEKRYRFDQDCRVSAIALAARLGMTTYLNINFMPNAVYRPEHCIQSTLRAAEEFGFPIGQIVFEVVENDHLAESSRLVEILSEYRRFGFSTAIDDFGAGFAELKMLARFQPDILKIDMDLVRGVDQDKARQAIVNGTVKMCEQLGVRALAEGVETHSEFAWLRKAGIELFQGYLFGRPGFEELPDFDPEAFAHDLRRNE
jgi:EAL domain-containing protein (putative c-di-GMP-specific phosphodiesterase class I)